MATFAGGRFRASVLLLPAARGYRARGVVLRLIRFRSMVWLLRLAQFLRFRHEYLANIQVASGGSRGEAWRRALGPYLRAGAIWHGAVAAYRRQVRPDWLDRVDVRGVERIAALHAAGTPVVLAVPHLGLSAMVLAHVLADRGVRCIIDNLAPQLAEQVTAVEAFDADLPLEGFRALQAGKVLIHGADAPAPGLPCLLFGRYVSFPPTIARAAARTGAVMAAAYCYERRPGAWQAVFEEPFPAGDVSAEADTRRVIDDLERIIRAHPFEWVLPLRPFLSRVGFAATGRLPLLVASVGPDPAPLRPRIVRRLRSYAGVEVHDADVTGVSLAALAGRLRAEGAEMLLLLRPELGDELGELPSLLTWLFRLDPDAAAYEPPAARAAAADDSRALTAYTLCLVKAAVLEALAARGVARLDAAALRQAKRLGFRCVRVLTEAELLARTQPLRGELHRLRAEQRGDNSPSEAPATR